jgi:phosphatidylserine synthase
VINTEGISDFFGFVSLLLFVFANAYYPARLIANQYKPWPRDIAIFFKKYLDLHMWINVVAFVTMSIHAHFSDERNLFLYASLLVTVWLTFAGILMRSKSFSSDTKKQMRLIHTQQTVFLVWLVLLIVGHLVE